MQVPWAAEQAAGADMSQATQPTGPVTPAVKPYPVKHVAYPTLQAVWHPAYVLIPKAHVANPPFATPSVASNKNTSAAFP